MDISTLILADRLSRERAAALDREHAIKRTLADRGTLVTPERPQAVWPVGMGVWFRRHFAWPRQPRFV